MSAFWLKYRGTRFPLRRGETVIGRSPYCSIVLSNSRASRQHCAITWDEHGLTLTDLGSSNGTFLNGSQLKGSARLEPGDVLSVGTDVLEVVEVRRKATEGITRTEQNTLPTVEVYEFDETQSTRRQEMTLDVIEAIAARAAEEGLSDRWSATVMRATDLFLTALARSGRRLTPADGARLAAVTEMVGARADTTGVSEWKRRTIERIAHNSMLEDSI